MLELIRKLIEWLAGRGERLENTPAGPEPLLATTAGLVLRQAITPALTLLPAHMDTPRARVLMLAIAGQEADFRHRYQILNTPGVKGPARGLWQFERGGGVAGVLRHSASSECAQRIARERIGSAVTEDVWAALEHDDILAAAFARLLLWTDPAPLPEVGDVEGSWQLYLRCWRPGAWTRGSETQRASLREKWAGYYARAMQEVTA